MLIVGWLILGRQFALNTIVSSLSYPVALKIIKALVGNYVITDDIFLCTIFTGLGIGITLGLVIRTGASTGGMDIPPLVLQKLFKIPASATMYCFDFGILLLQCWYNKPESVLYGLIMILTYTMVLDKLLTLGASRTEIKVVSSKYQEIRESILKEVDRGVTMIDGETGYLGNDTQIVLSIVSNRELARTEKLILSIDPVALIVVSRVSEVQGRGFSLKKVRR